MREREKHRGNEREGRQTDRQREQYQETERKDTQREIQTGEKERERGIKREHPREIALISLRELQALRYFKSTYRDI